MCDLCKMHGKGTKWYLNPDNYRRELGLSMRKTYEKLSGRPAQKWLAEQAKTWDPLFRMPIIGLMFRKYYDWKISKIGGQIIPLKDLFRVLDLSEDHVVFPCPCRRLAGEEVYTCLHFGVVKDLYTEIMPKGKAMKVVSKEEIKEQVSKFNDQGLFHLVLPLEVPYVYNVCNCDLPYCWAWRARFVYGLNHMLRKGEYVAVVDQEICEGCVQTCMTRCAFGAIRHNKFRKKAFINIQACFGCGLCVSACPYGAITMVDRVITPVGNLW